MTVEDMTTALAFSEIEETTNNKSTKGIQGEETTNNKPTKSIQDEETTNDNNKHKKSIRDKLTKNKLLLTIVFLTGGLTAALSWNCMITAFVTLQKFIYPGNTFPEVLGATEVSMALLVSLIMYYVDDPKALYEIITGTFSILIIFLIPLIINLFPGNENLGIAKILLILLAAFVGIECGITNTVMYSLAGLVSTQSVGLVSMGCGLSGVWAFFSFFTLSEFVFEKSLAGQIRLLWCFYGIASIFFVVHVICLSRLNRKRWFQDLVRMEKNNSAQLYHVPQIGDTRSDDTLVAPTTTESRWDLFKVVFAQCGIYGLAHFLNMLVTLMLYPLFGPYSWNQSYKVTTIVTGIFQITNMLSRYGPVVLPQLNVNKKYILWVILARALIFFPTFILPARSSSPAMFHSPYYLVPLMFLFALVHGWCTTLSTIFCIDSVTGKLEKSMASKVQVVAAFTACIIGLCLSRVIKDLAA